MSAPRFDAIVLPNELWPDLVRRWHRLEAGGLDGIWSCDHFTNPHRPGQPWFEGATSLMALALATERVRIGLLVASITSRHPTLFTQEAKTVDHASRGRLDIGMGAGGAPTDAPMWGVGDWPPVERAARFAEYVELVDRLAREALVTYDGQWYATQAAAMDPGFLQRPRPPLLIAAHGTQTLEVAARYADNWNTFGPTLEEARKSSGRLDAFCDRNGRDPNEIRRSALLGLMSDTAWTTANEFDEQVRRWHDAGFTHFIFYDPPYAREGVPRAEPRIVEELLANTIQRLRQDLA
jgi:alkanesulfonate monooxygenase SsuD/methylene tetrahydromethanopterin reductase-like flavin-dependent oxidoreductase (luciferase family)